MEIWKDIPDYEGYYQISDHGNVRSVDRYVKTSTGNRLYKSKLIKNLLGTTGYYYVTLAKNGMHKRKSVHRMVCLAFYGLPPNNNMEVCHNDANRVNNRLNNLRWDTKSANANDRVKHGNNEQANKKYCPKGHLLQSPNLVEKVIKLGWRNCLACHRTTAITYSRKKRQGIVYTDKDIQIISDNYYKEIMCEH